MSASNVTKLFKLCVQTTYFVFNKKLYKQIDGLAIGASSSGFAAELFMEKLEAKAIATFIVPPEIWLRYVDDTFSKLKRIYVTSFLQHLNNQHPRIKFTSETQENGTLPFLDVLNHVLEDGSTKATIQRKATHTDQYLDFQSNHHIKQKIGLISTFKHRIKTIVTKEEDQKTELQHVKKALKRCGHPNWVLNRKSTKKQQQKEKVERRGKVFLPYVKGISEKMARVFKKYDLETIHKPSATLKNLICNKMKDQVHPLDKTGSVYYNYCKKHTNPKNDYVGETDRVNRERGYEHGIIDHKTAKRSASLDYGDEQPEKKTTTTGTRRSTRNKNRKDYKSIQEGSDQRLSEGNTEFSAHVASDIHNRKEDLVSTILCTDESWYRRGVKEAIAIRKLKPTLNKDDGRHHLSPIYNKLIQSSVTLKTSRTGGNNGSEEQRF